MGRRDRERIARIIQGIEPSIASLNPRPVKERMLTCKHCKVVVEESKAREHIRSCWNYPIKDDEPIPSTPIIRTAALEGAV